MGLYFAECILYSLNYLAIIFCMQYTDSIQHDVYEIKVYILFALDFRDDAVDNIACRSSVSVSPVKMSKCVLIQ